MLPKAISTLLAGAALLATLPGGASAGIFSSLGESLGRRLGRRVSADAGEAAGEALTRTVSRTVSKSASERAAARTTKAVMSRVVQVAEDGPRTPLVIADRNGRIVGQLADPVPKLNAVKVHSAKVARVAKKGTEVAGDLSKFAAGLGAGGALVGTGTVAVHKLQSNDKPTTPPPAPDPEREDTVLGQP